MIWRRYWMAAVPLVVLMAGCREAGAQEKPVDPAKVIARGREVYLEQRCGACHSIERVGNRQYPLDGVGAKLSPADIRTWIVAPREMNPRVAKRAFDKLPPRDLDALVAYLVQLKKK
jgi:mono/diheme cytochrome c family protein